MTPTRLVAAVWLGLTAALFASVAHFGVNAPMWEEWLDVAALYGEADRLDWVFGRLLQHRYVLGRAAMLGLFHATGHDFRAGLFVSVTLLSLASAVVAVTLRQARGRTHAVDAVAPALLMNPGGWENLILGYQMHFTIDVMLVAILFRCVALADVRPPAATACRVAVLTPLLALGGWVGLAFVPGLAAWVTLLVARDRRLWPALALPLAACVYFAWAYLDVRAHPVSGQAKNDWPDQLRVATEFLGMAFGNFGESLAPVAGLVAVAGLLVLAGRLAAAWRSPCAAGGLAVLLALVLMAYGTGQYRPFGYAVRNVPLLAYLPLLGLAVAVKFGPTLRPRSDRGLTLATLALAVALQADGWFEACRHARYHRDRVGAFARDRDAGLPLRFLVSRHGLYACPDLFSATEVLRDRGHPFAGSVADGPPLLAVPVAVRDGRVRLPEPRTVAGLRVALHYPNATERFPVAVAWRGPGGAGSSVCHPWLTPGDWTLDFPVGAWVDEFQVTAVRPAEAFTVLSAEILIEGQAASPKPRRRGR